MSSDSEFVEITAFGHKFVVHPAHAEDLITLEREGAIYSHFYDQSLDTLRDTPRFYKIRLLPSEIYQFVEGHIAKQQYDAAIRAGYTFEKALEAIQDKSIADRVRKYRYLHQDKLDQYNVVVDVRGCIASFWPRELEELTCGKRNDRYELLPNWKGIDKASLLVQMLDYFPVVARYISARKHGRPSYQLLNEYDTQDLLYVVIRSVFEDAQVEEWTPKHAGKSKRIDIVVPSIKTAIEIKHIRDLDHARNVADELKVDIESYHAHPSCETFLALVYDPNKHIVDPAAITKDMSGRRTKSDHSFDVMVLIR